MRRPCPMPETRSFFQWKKEGDKMSYTCYLGGALWPTPEKLQVKIKGKNKTLVLLNEGEVNFLRAPGLTELTVPFDLPMLTGSRSPDYYLGLLERMKANKETTQFMLVRMSPSGGCSLTPTSR